MSSFSFLCKYVCSWFTLKGKPGDLTVHLKQRKMRQNILDVYDSILEYAVKGCVKLGLLQSWALLVEKSHGETPTGFTEHTYHENLILLLHWTNELANLYSVNSCFNSHLTQNDAGVKSSLFPSNLLFCSREEKGLWGEMYGRSKSPHYSPSRVTTNRLLHDPTVTAWTVCKMNKGVTSVKSLHSLTKEGDVSGLQMGKLGERGFRCGRLTLGVSISQKFSFST